MTNFPSIEYFVVLTSNRIVKKWIYDKVKALALEFIPYMKPGHSYNTESVCGMDFWEIPVAGVHIAAGMSLTDMAKNNVLPIVCLNPEPKSGPKKFCLSPDYTPDID